MARDVLMVERVGSPSATAFEAAMNAALAPLLSQLIGAFEILLTDKLPNSVRTLKGLIDCDTGGTVITHPYQVKVFEGYDDVTAVGIAKAYMAANPSYWYSPVLYRYSDQIPGVSTRSVIVVLYNTDAADGAANWDPGYISTGGGGGGGSATIYNVMLEPFNAVGTSTSTPLTADEAAEYNANFAAYGATGGNAIAAGDQRDWAAWQCALWKAAVTGAQVYGPAGGYILDEPLRLSWTATPITGQPARPRVSRISGDGISTVLIGRGIGAGRGVVEMIGESHTYAANIEISSLVVQEQASCHVTSYCLRLGDGYCGINLYRVLCYGANGLLLRVASSLSYAEICFVATQCQFWSNRDNLWGPDSGLSVYSLNNESAGGNWDIVTFIGCLFWGQAQPRAWAIKFDTCIFATPPDRATPDNVVVRIGVSEFDNCYFEDHRIAIVSSPDTFDIGGLTVRDSHFSSGNNLPGPPNARSAIQAGRTAYEHGPVLVEKCRFGVTHTFAEIELYGPLSADVKLCSAPFSPVNTGPRVYAVGGVRMEKWSPNGENPYDIHYFDGVRPNMPFVDGAMEVVADVVGEHRLKVNNENSDPASYSVFEWESDGFTARAVAFGPNYVSAAVRNTLALFPMATGDSITLGGAGAEVLRFKQFAGPTARAFVGSVADDGVNIWQFNTSLRLSGWSSAYAATSVNIQLTKDMTRFEFFAACTATLPLGNAWGTSVAGRIELHNSINSTGYVTVPCAASDVFPWPFLTGITIAPGETVFLCSNGASPATWSIARANSYRAPYNRFVQTAFLIYDSSAAKTQIVNTGVGDLGVLANSMTPGQTIRIRAAGTVRTNGTPTSTLQLELGATVLATIGPVTLPATIPDTGWSYEADITCLTTGVGGTLAVQARWTGPDGVTSFSSNVVAVAYDLTTSNSMILYNTFSASDVANRWRTTNYTMTVEG